MGLGKRKQHEGTIVVSCSVVQSSASGHVCCMVLSTEDLELV